MMDFLTQLFPNGITSYWQAVALGMLATGWGMREFKYRQGPDCSKCGMDTKLMAIQVQVNQIWQFLAERGSDKQ